MDFVVLFGSQVTASGERPARDVDLALMPGPGSRDQEELELGLLRALDRGDLDLVWLPHSDWLLGWQVSVTGRVLYERCPRLFDGFKVRAALRHADGRIWHRRRLDFLKRISEGSSRVVNIELVASKLAHVAQYLQELELFTAVSLAEFEGDVKTRRAAERQAELLVECAAAINTEVAQSIASIPPSDYYSSFFSFANTGWLDREVARRLADMAGLRNRLVHQYEEVVVSRLYKTLRRSLPDWRAYLESVRSKLAELEGG